MGENKSVFGKLKADSSDCYVFDGGLTLRDYFAAMAMQGLLSHPRNPDGLTVVNWAYSMADAMLEERGK